MAFTLTLVVLTIYHELLTGSNSVELIRKNLTDGERLKTFQRGHENNEHYQRRIHFQNSLKRQAFLNSVLKRSDQSAHYGINQFSDLSPQQFKERYLTARTETAPKFDPSRTGIQVKINYPPKFDWRDHGIVGPVRNQKSCGGCWAFSVVEAIETVSAKDGGKLQQLSVQQVIDCSYENEGCNGGSPVGALDWLAQTKLKLVNEAEYPFKDMAGICQYFPQSHAGVAVRNYSAYDFSGQEEVMMSVLVESGPLVVIVDAISWQDYLGGIIQHHCSSHNANHAVLITGYDTTGEVPYWIVRNSWGTSWGDNGYAYIKIGNDMCGIADNVAAVFV
ncbi:cathepsin O [Sinocyclocheilus rhinocerous]|uniref:Cathepsin O n=1 Tax=Sinocyclocheilus rhinocerous TaxID=307959 RepID=A0A673GIP0_9TELE|nr:PREDICTED: cathepsin O-like [Sinocyclocheilus rhinocerous]